MQSSRAMAALLRPKRKPPSDHGEWDGSRGTDIQGHFPGILTVVCLLICPLREWTSACPQSTTYPREPHFHGLHVAVCGLSLCSPQHSLAGSKWRILRPPSSSFSLCGRPLEHCFGCSHLQRSRKLNQIHHEDVGRLLSRKKGNSS